jgi:type VI secretion system secreted protein Hcp
MVSEPGRTVPDIPYAGAHDVFLQLEANGVQIQGESDHKGHEHQIECVYFTSGVETVRLVSGTGMASGRRTHGPIVVRKRVDRATPLIAKALVQNEVVDAHFEFFRATPEGAEEHFFTIEIAHGRVATQTTYSADNVALPGHEGVSPFMEQVHFVYQRIKWSSPPGAIEFEDSWGMV